jgi:hypothetical protein
MPNIVVAFSIGMHAFDVTAIAIAIFFVGLVKLTL